MLINIIILSLVYFFLVLGEAFVFALGLTSMTSSSLLLFLALELGDDLALEVKPFFALLGGDFGVLVLPVLVLDLEGVVLFGGS